MLYASLSFSSSRYYHYHHYYCHYLHCHYYSHHFSSSSSSSVLLLSWNNKFSYGTSDLHQLHNRHIYGKSKSDYSNM